jgi:hypothetical protein
MTIKWDLRLAISIALFVSIVAGAVMTCYVSGRKQQDFVVYYAAASAFRQGLDPYDVPNLARAIGKDESNPYNYPPGTLYVYLPFAYFSLGTAARIYLTLKLGAVGVLLFLWNRIFRFKEYLYLLFLIAPLAFNGTLLDDLGVGNISVFEQLWIWIGFYFYTRNNLLAFVVAIMLASAFKMVTMLLLLILITRLRKKDCIYLVASGLAFAVFLAANALFWPHYFAGFVHNVTTISGGDRGSINPALMIFLKDVVTWLSLHSGYPVPVFFAQIAYVLICAPALYMAWLAFTKMRSMDPEKADRWRICLTCLLYAMLMPRFKNYSGILIIAPALYAILSRPLVRSWLPFCVLLVIYTYPVYEVLGRVLAPFYQAQTEYYCLFLAWLIGILFCYSFLNESPDFIAELDRAPGSSSSEKPLLEA